MRDLHAPVMRLLGIDHERFTLLSQGLDFRRTGEKKANVAKGILA